jgi:hypothetical protein
MKTSEIKSSSEHTGNDMGFSWSACDRCESKLGGDRFEWFIILNEIGKNEVSEMGECCGDCLEEINN